MSSFCGSDNDENDYEIGYREGAAVAFGLMGMAEAIREIYLHIIPTDYSVMWDEACGSCQDCDAPFEVVRPGKEQPTCNCYEDQQT